MTVTFDHKGRGGAREMAGYFGVTARIISCSLVGIQVREEIICFSSPTSEVLRPEATGLRGGGGGGR